MLPAISFRRHRYVPHVRTDNSRVAPLDALQVDVFAAFVEALPAKPNRSGERR